MEGRILISGGAGFIGSHLVEELYSHNVEITIVDNLSKGLIADIKRIDIDDKINFIVNELDTTIETNIISLDNYDYFFHCAANSYVPISVTDPAFDFKMNIVNSFKILEKLRNLNKRPLLINISSVAVYGSPANTSIIEEDPTVPISPYGVSKLAVERYAEVYYKIYGVPSVTARLASVYGPRQKKQIIYDLFKKLRKDTSILEVYGTGLETRDMVYVKDVVRGLLLIAEKSTAHGEVYNLATGRNFTINSIVDLLCQVAGCDPQINYTGKVRDGDALNWEININKIKSISFSPQYDLKEGLEETFQWLNIQNSY